MENQKDLKALNDIYLRKILRLLKNPGSQNKEGESELLIEADRISRLEEGEPSRIDAVSIAQTIIKSWENLSIKEAENAVTFFYVAKFTLAEVLAHARDKVCDPVGDNYLREMILMRFLVELGWNIPETVAITDKMIVKAPLEWIDISFRTDFHRILDWLPKLSEYSDFDYEFSQRIAGICEFHNNENISDLKDKINQLELPVSQQILEIAYARRFDVPRGEPDYHEEDAKIEQFAT